ncbi:hypothetical protein GCM10027290_32370 [Micromonospora sonneratiae]|uniref:Immunity protein 53 n=1 Tax=Micromonospora sonneratiae TaxID=1184706 RepID=A0ABW3YAZ1_9ACTN
MRDSEPTPDETTFFHHLSALVPGLDDWYHADDDGGLWMMASYDFTANNAVCATLRVDYDGQKLRGGWSPACLNWDDGVRAEEALISTASPEGLHLDDLGPYDAAVAAAAWFQTHISHREPGSQRSS